jgi:UPF0042 nucleotide-binding protein
MRKVKPRRNDDSRGTSFPPPQGTSQKKSTLKRKAAKAPRKRTKRVSKATRKKPVASGDAPSSSAHFVFITGLSGSGKTLAMKALEDTGFFCVDNLPPELIDPFAELTAKGGDNANRVAIVADIRERGFLRNFPLVFRRLRQRGIQTTLLFLEARNEVLVRRFSESRRPHPLASTKGGAILEAVKTERRKLSAIRRLADVILDTSSMTAHQLRRNLLERFTDPGERKVPALNVVSFGYKYGIPLDADLVFDVRFLANPYFESKLRKKDGNDPLVEKFIMSHRETKEFLARLKSFVDYLIPKFALEGKSYLTIAVGCTGGRHRSVMVANVLARHIVNEGRSAKVMHRDVENE